MARPSRYWQSWTDAALFPELSRKTAALRIARQLREAILNDTLRPESRLPGQREMAQHMRVSVSTLREAVAILVAEGLVVCRQGLGTFVVPRRPRRIVEIAVREASDVELDDARRFIEAGAAQRAARRAARDGHDVLRPPPMSEYAWALQLRHDGQADAWLRLDAEFHAELCRLGATRRSATGQVGAAILERLQRRRSAGVHRLVADNDLLELHHQLAVAVDHGHPDRAARLARRIVRREAAAVR